MMTILWEIIKHAVLEIIEPATWTKSIFAKLLLWKKILDLYMCDVK